MIFDSELISLLLYSLQQLGVMLGVGAETIILLVYLITMRDGVVERAEERFAHAVGWVLNAGLILIVTSGVGIVTMHLLAREIDILLLPAFIFKWLLVGVVLLCAVFIRKNIFPQASVEAFAGASWYALFIVHILAPRDATWPILGLVYAMWLAGFALCWFALTHFTKHATAKPATVGYGDFSAKKSPEVASPSLGKPPPVAVLPTPKPLPIKVAPPPPKPMPPPPPPKPPAPANLPVVAHVELSPPKPIPKPEPLKSLEPFRPVVSAPKVDEQVKDPDESPFLPAIHVMPKTPEDVEKKNRASVVRFE